MDTKLKKEKNTNSIWEGVRGFAKRNMGILIALIALILLFSLLPRTSSKFLTTLNITNVVRQASTNLYIAIAMTMVIILGGIDLSSGSVIALTGCVTGGLIAYNGVSLWLAVLVGLLVGAFIGLVNGFVISRTTIPPFIVTLSTMNIGMGLAYIYTGGKPIRIVNDQFNMIGSGSVFGIPLPIIYLVVITSIAVLIMNKTKLGRHIYAVGGNKQAAEFSGIKTKRVELFVYLFAGLMSAVAGIVLASRMFSGQPTAGDGAEMDAIAAVVVGGTSMTGGVGTIGGTIIGGFIIAILNNGLNLLGVDSFWQYVVKGIVILLAVYVDYIRNKKLKQA